MLIATTQAGGIRVSISVGGSKSDSSSESLASKQFGSTVVSAGAVNISATGAGTDSNINLVGTQLHAGGAVSLNADNQVNLLAANSTASQNSKNSSSSGSIGISFGVGGGGGAGLSLDVAASQARGGADGKDNSYGNTNIQSQTSVSIKSDGDTNLIGGTVSGPKVSADVGGNLNIASLQDSSQFKSQQKSTGFSASISYGGGGSLNV